MYNYSNAVNKAAYDLALEVQSLVLKKGQLLSLAKAEVDKGAYSYKKKMTRSLLLSLPEGNPAFTKLFPSKRIEQIQEHLSDLKRARQPQQ